MSGDDTSNALTRRRFAQALGVGSAAALAGCMGGGGGDSDTTTGNGGGTTTGGSGAGTTTDAPTRSIELSGWAANNQEAELLQQLITDFDKSHKSIKVDYHAIQSKYKQKLKTQLGAGNAPDAFYVDSKYFGSFAKSGVLLDLGSIGKREGFDTDDFYQPLLDAFKYNGTQYGYPKDFSTLGLFHNTAMFEKAGVEPPKNWSDLRKALRAVKQKTDVEAPMIEYPNARVWKGLIYQNGGQIVNDDSSKAVFASDAGIEALQYLVDLRKDGLLAVPSELGAGWHGAALGSKQVATAVLGPWGLPFLKENHPKVNENIDVVHIPIPKGGEKATPAYTVSYSGSAQTKAPDATRELIGSLTSKQGMKQWAQAGLALTARQSLADIEYYNNHPRRKTLLEAGNWSHVVNYGPKTSEIINILHPQLEAAMLMKKSPQKALETAQTKINSQVF